MKLSTDSDSLADTHSFLGIKKPSKAKRRTQNKERTKKKQEFCGPPIPFELSITAELCKARVNIAFKTLNLYSVSGCKIERGNQFDAIRRALEHNLRDDLHHHEIPGRIDRSLSHLNQVLVGLCSVAGVVDQSIETFAALGIVPPRVDSIMAIEGVLYPGLIDPRKFFPWAIEWFERHFVYVVSVVWHRDQQADHAHVIALAIEGGKLAGGMLASGENSFLDRHRAFLAAATAKFGPCVRQGHDRNVIAEAQTLGDFAAATGQGHRAKGSRPARATGSPRIEGFDGRATGSSAKGSQTQDGGGETSLPEEVHQGSHGDIAGHDVPQEVAAACRLNGKNNTSAPPVSANSTLAQLKSDNHRLTQELAAVATARLSAEAAVLEHLEGIDAVAAADLPARGVNLLKETQTAKASADAFGTAATGDIADVSCNAGYLLAPYLAGLGWLSAIEVARFDIPYWRGSAKVTQALEGLVQAGKAEVRVNRPKGGPPKRQYRVHATDQPVAAIPLQDPAVLRAQDAELIPHLQGLPWSTASALVRRRIAGWTGDEKLRRALERLFADGKAEKREVCLQGHPAAAEYRVLPLEPFRSSTSRPDIRPWHLL